MPDPTLHRALSSTLVAASRHWRRLCHATLSSYGISEACAGPLLAIARLGDGVHQVKVAHAAGMESPTLVRLLDQLCRAGLVCRSEDPQDRRAKALSLTSAGRERAASIEVELTRLRAGVLLNIPDQELQIALRVLQAFSDAVPAEADPA